MPNDLRKPAQFSRRHFFKAAGVAIGALAGSLPGSAHAQWGDRNGGGGNSWGSGNPWGGNSWGSGNPWGGDHGGGGGDGGGSGWGHCFLRGTLVRTVNGYRPIERLAVGDLLPTHFSGRTAIRKIANYTVRRDEAGQWPEDCRLVRISTGALGENIPSRDLFVTNSHAVFLSDVLVPIGSLVNGKTICFDDRASLALEYFHIEFDTHDVIDAEGALCESLRDETMDPCAPVLAFNGGRSQLSSHLRSAIAPFVDRRRPLDLIRDGLEARAGL